jgi:hypothetical protein
MTAESFDIFEMVSGRFKTSHGETKAARSFMLLWPNLSSTLCSGHFFSLQSAFTVRQSDDIVAWASSIKKTMMRGQFKASTHFLGLFLLERPSYCTSWRFAMILSWLLHAFTQSFHDVVSYSIRKVVSTHVCRHVHGNVRLCGSPYLHFSSKLSSDWSCRCSWNCGRFGRVEGSSLTQCQFFITSIQSSTSRIVASSLRKIKCPPAYWPL